MYIAWASIYEIGWDRLWDVGTGVSTAVKILNFWSYVFNHSSSLITALDNLMKTTNKLENIQPE